MSIKKGLAVALADYLPVFGAVFGVTLLGVSTYFGNVTMFLLSIVTIAVLPPTLESVGHSLKEKYEATQNETDIIAMIPEWSLGYEMLISIAIMIASVILKSITIFYLGAWLLCIGDSLGMAKEINGLKEDLRSPDLEKRRAAMEKVESDKQIAAVSSFILLLIDILILLNAVLHPTVFTQAEVAMTIMLIPISLIPCCIVYGQADKVMPPEPEKAARAAS